MVTTTATPPEMVSAAPSSHDGAIVPHPAGEFLLLSPEELQRVVRELLASPGTPIPPPHTPPAVVVEAPPDDVLLIIASYLAAPDLARLAGACKAWRELLSSTDHERLWAAHLDGDFGVRPADMRPRPANLRALYGALVEARGDLYRGAAVRSRVARVMATPVAPAAFSAALEATGAAAHLAPPPASSWLGWGWDRLTGMVFSRWG